MKKTRGSTSEHARNIRQQGHDDALEFAILIGVADAYTNDLKAKKDVVDKSGDAHSVKSGNKKWQIFLYGANRFLKDESYQAMNGMGQLLVECINSFPLSFDEYSLNKSLYKEKLKPHMIKLQELLQSQNRVKSFFSKAIFNHGEVKYLTIKSDDIFHVFLNSDINTVFAENLIVENSIKRSVASFDAQKVIFKYDGLNLAELEMRNDTPIHYREIRFNMIKPRAMKLFFEKIPRQAKFSDRVHVYGNASKTFGRWK